MQTILCHKDVFMPKGAQETVNEILKKYSSYKLSHHVISHATQDNDRSHEYTLDKLNKAIENALGKPFEAFEIELTRTNEAKTWTVTKVCIRIPYDIGQEACLSIRPSKNKNTGKYDITKAFIVTAWLNSVSDAHFTLDSSKYISEEQFKRMSI